MQHLQLAYRSTSDLNPPFFAGGLIDANVGMGSSRLARAGQVVCIDSIVARGFWAAQPFANRGSSIWYSESKKRA